MSGDRLSLYLNCFTFGAPPRRLLIAILVEGLALFGLLEFTAEGLLDTTVVPQFAQMLTIVAIVVALLTYLIAWSAAKDSLSPILHTDFVPGLITAGYLLLGVLVTGIGFLAHMAVFQTPFSLSPREIRVGISLGAVFGFFILLYFDRFEIEAPDNRQQFEDAVDSVQEKRKILVESNQPPIKLTGRYRDFESSVDEMADLLKKSETKDGKRLAREVETWVDGFRSRPEVSKASIVDWSVSPEQKELKEQKQELKSIVKRIEKIANHG